MPAPEFILCLRPRQLYLYPVRSVKSHILTLRSEAKLSTSLVDLEFDDSHLGSRSIFGVAFVLGADLDGCLRVSTQRLLLALIFDLVHLRGCMVFPLLSNLLCLDAQLLDESRFLLTCCSSSNLFATRVVASVPAFLAAFANRALASSV